MASPCSCIRSCKILHIPAHHRFYTDTHVWLILRIGQIFIVIVCWLSAPLGIWADSSLPLLRASSSTAQQIREEALYLKEETVSIASRYEQPISKAPSDVYVITDEDIKSSGATDIPTLLRQVPGIDVMQTSAVDFNVSVRGNNQVLANKLLILVDGRSIYIDQSGQVLWKLLPVALTEIKRIEVLKGPASALYGFNAFDGVVNMITKSPEEMRGSTLQVAGGGLGTILTTGVHAGTVGNWGYRLSGGHEQNQRWLDSSAPALNNQRIGGMAEYQLTNRGRIRAEAGMSRSSPYNGLVTAVTNSNTYPSQAHALLRYEQSGLLIRGWWNSLFFKTTDTLSPALAPLLALTDQFGRTGEDASFNSYDLETRYRFNPLEALKLNIGTNFRHIVASWNYLHSRTVENRLGFYAQGDWQVLPSLEVNVGLRYDLDTHVAAALSPRGAIIYHMTPNHAFRLSGSVAYRPPTTFDVGQQLVTLLTPPGMPPTRITTLGSGSVKPEQIISYELGYQGWWWDHRLRTRLTGFYNHISDLIAFQTFTGNSSNPISPVNGGVADIYGGEAGLEVLFTSWFSGFANYANQEVGQSSTGSARRGSPHYKVNAGLRINRSPFTGEILYHHVSAAAYPLSELFTNLGPLFPTGTVLPHEHVPSYNLLNLRLGYTLWRQQTADYVREAELALSVFNALNDNHREHPLGDLLGTRVLGWLTVKL
ncbi:MAG: TonB-dependent receptor [Nitrospira sp.]|nr:TonB-dependent receptor [Nitrospira sp.]